MRVITFLIGFILFVGISHADTSSLSGLKDTDTVVISIESAKIGKSGIQIQRKALSKRLNQLAEEDVRLQVSLAKRQSDRNNRFVSLVKSPQIKDTFLAKKNLTDNSDSLKVQSFRIPGAQINAALKDVPENENPRLVFYLLQNDLQVSNVLKLDALELRKLQQGMQTRTIKDINADKMVFSNHSKVTYQLRLEKEKELTKASVSL